jgi:hypothetical protein
MPFLVHAMDSPIFDAPCSIAVEYNNNSRIINIANVREIAFLGNTQLIVIGEGKNPSLINLDSKDRSYFSRASIPFRCSLAADQSKKRVLFSREDDQARIRVYDSVSKEFALAHISYDDESGKYFPVCFDERKPHSVLVEKGVPTSIVSYNYITQEISSENCLSEGFKDDSLKNCQYLCNPRLGLNGIIGQCTDGFKIYYDSPQSVYRQVKKYDVIPTIQKKSYICAPDLSFVVYYALFRRVLFRVSDMPDSYRCEADFDNGCYISYLNGDKTTSSLRGNSGVSVPCAMVMHPNGTVFAIMLAGDRIIQYFNSQGIFLAEQKISRVDGREFGEHIGITHKYLDFSANGELLAAVFSYTIGVFPVAFHVQCGIKEDKLLLIFQCLKNYQLNGNVLPKDIVRLLLYSLKR